VDQVRAVSGQKFGRHGRSCYGLRGVRAVHM
jgi:hypothetical protein